MQNVRSVHRYGWKKDLPDHRDQFLTAVAPTQLTRMDLRPWCPAIYDQGDMGSCTGNASAAYCEFDLIKEGKVTYVPSRLFIYYNERYLEGTTGYDSGAEIRDAIKALATWGFCDEQLWPYSDNNLLKKPAKVAYTSAKKELISNYARVNQDLASLRGCLAAKEPVIFGFTVYESFESQQVATTGIVPMPGPDESVVGGHAVLIVGYDDEKQMFLVRNSWGEGWGEGGYFWMPYAYVLNPNLASDFWIVRFVK